MYIDKETGKVLAFCCEDMEFQWGKIEEIKEGRNEEGVPDLNKEHRVFFFYDPVAEEVEQRILDWFKCGHEPGYFLSESFYSLTTCPFCGKPFEIIKKIEDLDKFTRDICHIDQMAEDIKYYSSCKTKDEVTLKLYNKDKAFFNKIVMTVD